jgi:hypothetical protein
MANTYNFTLTSLKKENLENLQNAILEVNWCLNGNDDDNNWASFYNKTQFNLNDVDSENFIAYDDLTEEIVVNWVKDSLGFETNDSKWLSIKYMVDTELEKTYNEKRMVNSSQFPWATESELTTSTSGSI